MKTINKLLIGAFVAFAMLSITSCDDYLDVSDELAENLTIDGVFENANYTRRWHGNIFNCIIVPTGFGSQAGAMTNPWSDIAGELMCNSASSKNVMVTGYTPANAGYHRWATQYMYIRQAQLFLERAHPIGNESLGGNNLLTRKDYLRMMDEAKFLIAYSYFTLFELYGPVPLITAPVDTKEQNLDFRRSPMDKVIEYIDKLLEEIIDADNLPETIRKVKDDGAFDGYEFSAMVRPTKVAALALRAKLWVYAASKLFNGGWDETQKAPYNTLFPAYDPDKWQTAKIHLETFLEFAHDRGHQLYSDPSGDPHESVYQLFQQYNDEIIWATSYNDYSNNTGQERRTNPQDVHVNGQTTFANIGVSQETVDAFFTADGFDIHDSGSGYNENGFTNVENPANVSKRVDTNIFTMYANREPRFYASVGYNGKSWHLNANAEYQQWYARGKASDISHGDNCPRGGYLLYKFKNRRMTQETTTSITVNGTTYALHATWARPTILFRLADFYLYYAEVLNEIDPGNGKIIEYIDKVRERAGIPGYLEMDGRGLKKGVIGNKEAQFKAIVQERHVELLAEGQRWFDMRRWMICDPVPANQPDKGGVDGDITRSTGMNMNGFDNVAVTVSGTLTLTRPLGSPDSFYQRVQVEKRGWRAEMYWYPIPQNEINKSKGHLLMQNPLWSTVQEPVQEPAE
jgi:hypothetical protein